MVVAAQQRLRIVYFLIRLAANQRARETSHEFLQPSAHPAAGEGIDIAPGKEQQVYSCRGTKPLREDIPRNAANTAPRRGVAGRPPQRHD